jgi:integrase
VRGHNEGTIWKRADGLWVAQVTLPNGKRKSKYSKTRKVVSDWLLETQKAIKDGMMVDSGKMTVTELLDKYFSEVAEHTLKPKTLESYESIIRLHLKPDLGGIKLSQLTPSHLQTLYSQKIKSGLSNRTVQYIHAVIHRALQQAVKWGLTVRNVADAVDAPKVAKKTPEMLTEAQVKQLIASSSGRMKIILIIATTCGLREGEILGLEWGDVSLEGAVIYVRHTTQTLWKKGIVKSEPKTEKGKRPVELPQYTVAALKQWQAETGDKDGLVIHTSSGKPFSSRNMLRDFAGLLKANEFPHVKFHSLRHFHATSLLKKNVNPKIVQERLGHSRIDMTLDQYSHVIPGMQKEAAGKIDEMFN